MLTLITGLGALVMLLALGALMGLMLTEQT
jgi:hypothetical protein